MTEICCDVATGAEAATKEPCEASSRAARRRRIEMRRFRFVAGAEAMAPAEESRKKRPRAEGAASNPEGSASDGTVGSGSSGDMSGDPPRAAGSIEEERAHEGSRFGMISVCGRRREMEDAVSIRADFVRGGRFDFFGVFDGHGCSHVAMSCKDRMHEVVGEEIERLREGAPSPTQGGWREAMERSFSRMDAGVQGPGQGSGSRNPRCRCELQTRKCDAVGSTAVVAVVGPTRIVVANCGDSRAVLCRNGVPVPLSSDHKPDRPDELQRIQAAGGRVIYWDGARVLGVLAMSRAIGDSYLKPFVTSEPEVTVTERTEGDDYLILASDGLWDVVSNEMACNVVRTCLRGRGGGAANGERELGSDRACADAALLLTKLALARHSADNISVVVVDLRKRGL
ncbi:putative protein phosphatase 2C 9 [Ananas comosus]|uniref:protein-serine/threonine phosphatase n=1 Tax=Ananas comosus TaxID=4615 RepID=A0A199W7U7_ANACO|nr:putative protein phosphatase 2C 9 [Ananas comosus]